MKEASMAMKQSKVHLDTTRMRGAEKVPNNTAKKSTIEQMRQRAREFDEDRKVWLKGIPA